MPKRSDVLVVRADAGKRMGTGHIMRCLALAQAWQDAGGQPVFAMTESLPALDARLEAERFSIEHLDAAPGSDSDAHQTAQLAGRLSAHWVVLDGYHFDECYERSVKKHGPQLLVMDDYGHGPHTEADLLVNQNLHANGSVYVGPNEHRRLLLGPSYALLRREFIRCRGWKREVPEVASKLLVTLGGTDADNVTLKVIQALEQQSADLETVVVMGDSNPHMPELEAGARRCKASVRLLSRVNNMAELMMWADLAVAAGGMTSWERLFFGLPSLVIVLADNQRPVAHALDQEGLACTLGWHGELSVSALAGAIDILRADRQRRAHMAEQGPRLVDGLGAKRVLECMCKPQVSLRPARTDDCRLLWEWANDPAVRAVSFNTDPIPWGQHQQWFAAKLNDRACVFWVAEDNAGTPIGQVRYDVRQREATMSISMEKNCRGKGQGTRIIREASRRLFAEQAVDIIHAFIREGNVASQRAFTRAGFCKAEETVVRGHAASRFEKRREQ